MRFGGMREMRPMCDGKGRGLAAPEPLRGEVALPLRPRTPKLAMQVALLGMLLGGVTNAATMTATTDAFRLSIRHNDTWYPRTAAATEGIEYSTAWTTNALEDANAVVKVYPAKRGKPKYIAIDLSGGTTAMHYPIEYLEDVPAGGWSDEYKTSKLVLRHIPAGSFIMGVRATDYPGSVNTNLHMVTLTRDFYMGVFEVTQRQWELVMGNRPSAFSNETCYATRPVERVSYIDIRGGEKGVAWPESKDVDDGSFMGVLRRKAGLSAFDLPTEAQWEYACRAGTTTALNTGKNLSDMTVCAEMGEAGRYSDNSGWYSGCMNTGDFPTSGVEWGTAIVGTYPANHYGLYDMHGNVNELCLDVWSETYEESIDPIGPRSSNSDEARRYRGGGWGNNKAYLCISGARRFNDIVESRRDYNVGFRLCLQGGEIPEAAEGVTLVNAAGEGTANWTPTKTGTYYLTHETQTNGVNGAELLGAWFTVAGPELTFEYDGGPFVGGNVTINGNLDGWTVYYTTDGSTPTAQSTAYTGPFMLPAAANVQAFAVSDGGVVTDVYSQQFDVAEHARIENVRARQRWPWNGKVDIDFDVVGDVTLEVPDGADIALLITATNRVAGTNYIASIAALSGDTGTAAGAHRVTWDLNAQGLDFESDDVVFTVAYSTAQYCVIDLSDGPHATSYPVSYMSIEPTGGWSDDFKTTKLVMRLIEPGSFMMCDLYNVTLSKPYYMGLFEVTQRQYELVMGNNPSENVGDMLPVENVSWGTIRGDSPDCNWPDSSNVASDSFIGRIRARTALGFDMPTEAQWEYACRAGTTTTYYWGDSMDGAYAWYMDSSGTTTHEVGITKQNAWGLYDMSGNVWEWCLDWLGSLSNDVTDPVGASSGTYRVIRGGSKDSRDYRCTSSYREGGYPLVDDIVTGFRIARNMSSMMTMVGQSGIICSSNSAVVAIDSRIGTRASLGDEALTYSSRWDGGDGATVTIAQDGAMLVEGLTGEGERTWSVTRNGTYVLTHTTYTNGVAGKVETATFVVTGKDVPFAEGDVTVSGYEAKYDGAAHGIGVTVADGIAGAVVRYATAVDGEFAATEPTLTDVGSMTVWCEIAAPGYITQTNSATVTITKRAVTLTSGDASKVYDGSPVLSGDVHIAGDGFAASEGATFTVTGSQTSVGTSENTFTYTLNEGTKAGNYDITTVNGTLTITRATVGPGGGGSGGDEPGGGEVPQGGESKFDTTAMYDGEGHTIDTNALTAAFGTAMIGESAVEYATDDGSGNGVRGAPALPWGTVPVYTNVGEYVVWYRVSNPNYNDFIHAAKVTITNRPVTVTVVGHTATYDYDTTEKGVAGYDIATEDTLYDIAADAAFRGGVIDAALPVVNRIDVGTTAMGLTVADFANNNANFLVTYDVTDGWVKVEPRVIGDNPANWDIRLARNPMYDGVEQTAPITQVAFVKPDGNLDYIPYTLSGNTATDAGNYVVRITGTGNYSGTVEKDWAITPRNVTLTSGSAEWVYDGTPHTQSAVSVTGDGFAAGEGASYSGFPVVRHVADAATPAANAFAYTLNNGTKAGNYSITTANGTVRMTPRAITLTAPTKSKQYDGTALTFTAAEVTATLTGEGGALGERALPVGEEFTLGDFASITEAGRVDATFTVADGTALMNDYAITTVKGTLTVMKNATEVTVTAKSGSWVYDGQSHALHEYEATNIGVLQAGDALEVTFGDESMVATPLDGPEGNGVVANVITGVRVIRNGTEDVTANYTLAPYNGTLTVTRRPVTLTSKSDTKAYDGTPLTAHEVTVGGDGFVGEDGANYAFTGSQTEKGTSKNAFTYSLKSGTIAAYYDITKVEGDLEVTAADISQGDEGDWQITFGPALTYTGLEQIQTLASVTYKGLPLDYSVSGNAQTDAGTYQMTLTGQGNFSGTHGVAWSIAPKALTLTAGSGSKVYDGTALTVGTVTANGFAPGEGAIYQCVGSQKNVGNSANEVSAIGWSSNTKASNYVVTKVAGTLTVTPRPVTLTAANISKPYDGTPLALTAADITASGIVAGESFAYSDFASRTEAGQTPATFSYVAGPGTSLANYSVTVTPGRMITITKSATAISVTAASESWVYDGEAHSNRTWTATNLSTLQAGDALVVTFAEASVVTTPQDGPAQDGVVPNTITSVRMIRNGTDDVTANYSVEWFPGTLTVTKRPVTVTVTGHTATYTYDGEEKTVTGYEITAEDTLYDIAANTAFGGVSETTRTDAGKSDMGLTAANFTNNDDCFDVTYAVTDGWVKIDPLDIASGAGAESFALVLGANPKYNGTVQTIAINSVTCCGLPVTYTLAGENATHAGTYTLTVKANGNFTGERSTTWQILKRTVTLTSGSASKVYDGTPVTCGDVLIAGDGFIGLEGATFDVTGSQTAAGTSKNTFTYTLKAGTLAGDYAITKVEGDLVVTKAKYPGQETGGAGIQWNVSADAATWMYDGVQHGVGLTGVPNGVTPHLSGNVATDVGSYTASVTFDYDADNYDPPVVPAPLAWSITKRPITLMAASKDKPYDGFPLEVKPGDITASGSGYAPGECFDYYDMASITEVGEIPATFSYRDSATAKVSNYAVTVVGGQTLKVTVGGDQISVTADSATWAYDGEQHVLPTWTVFNGDKLLSGHELQVKVSEESVITTPKDGPVQDGIVSNRFEYVRIVEKATGADKTRNYNLLVYEGTLQITNRVICSEEVIVNGEQFTERIEKVYDGVATGAVVTATLLQPAGVRYCGGHAGRVTLPEDTVWSSEPPEFTDAGEYTVWYEVTADYYDAFTGRVDIAIAKRAITLTSPTKVKNYDGAALTFGVGEIEIGEPGHAGRVTLPEGESLVFSNFASITDAGRVDATFDYAAGANTSLDNYAVTVVKGTLTVRASADEIAVTASDGTWMYDGEAHSLHEYTAENADKLQVGDELVVTFSEESVVMTPEDGPLADGVVSNAIMNVKVLRGGTEDVTRNYSLVWYPGTLTVTKARMTVDDASFATAFTYDGEGHTIALTPPTLLQSTAIRYGTAADTVTSAQPPKFTDAGTHTVFFTIAARYYETYAGSATVTIAPRPVTLVSAGAEKVYDGTPLHRNVVTVKDGSLGFADGEGVETTCTGSLTDVGGMENLFDYSFCEGTKADNYAITKEYGWLRVTPASLDTAPIGATASYTLPYDGEGHAFTVEPGVEPARVYYALVPGDESAYTNEVPVFTNATAEAVEVYFKILSPNYEPAYGTGTVWITKAIITPPEIPSKAYTGEPLTADVPESALWTVQSNPEHVSAGSYRITLRMKDFANMKWSNSSSQDTRLTFKIVRSANEWTVAPSITGWTEGESSSEPVASAKYGEVRVTYSGTTATGEMVTDAIAVTAAGRYTAIFEVEETESWMGLREEIDFTVTSRTGGGGGGTFTPLSYLARGYVGVYDGKGHSISVEVTGGDGDHVVTYALSADGPWQAVNPVFTAPCSQKVWFKIEAANFETVVGSARVSITGNGTEMVKDHVDVDPGNGAKTIPVPYSWFAGVKGLGERFGTDWDSVAYKPTGKKDAAGNALAVWHDYVAGTDPMDVKDVFHATIRMENDTPIIRWHPALNDTETQKGVRTGVRIYRVMGAETLGGEWKEVAPGEERRCRFFKVAVEVP